MSLASIITPAYNCEKWFKETFESVLKQSFKDFEWIIIDDCSTDNSYELISDLIKEHSNFKLLQCEKNSGSAVARNIGLKNASGKYVTFLDSDDLLDPNYLEEQVKFIKDNGPIITAGYRRMAENTTTNFVPRKSITYKQLLTGNDCSCLTTMYDREVVGDILFPEDLQRHEDFIFWLNILNKGYIVKGNDKILATYRIISGSKNSNKAKLLKPLFNVYHKALKLNLIKSCWYLLKYVLYSRKKYRNVI